LAHKIVEAQKHSTPEYHRSEADSWAKEISDPTDKSKNMTVTQIDEVQAHHEREYKRLTK